ncbi:hypothetical protein [Caudoviricetes sp.]|nr:hypothetical protein [Caudoviricetes sp.]
MIHVHIQFTSGADLDLDVDGNILISDFIDLANTIGGPIARLEFLP